MKRNKNLIHVLTQGGSLHPDDITVFPCAVLFRDRTTMTCQTPLLMTFESLHLETGSCAAQLQTNKCPRDHKFPFQTADNLTSSGSLRGLHLLKGEKGQRDSQEPRGAASWRAGMTPTTFFSALFPKSREFRRFSWVPRPSCAESPPLCTELNNLWRGSLPKRNAWCLGSESS